MNSFPLTKLRKHTIKIGSGITPKGGEATYKAQGIPLIRSQNVLVNQLNLSDVVFIDEVQHEKMSGSKVQPRDVLLNITGASIGRSCIVPDNVLEANVNQHVCIIRLKKTIDERLLSIFLNSKFGQKQICSFQSGGSREGLNFQQIGSFDIPLPSLPEQKAIADLISNWDEAIEKTERLIQAKEKRFQLQLTELILFIKNHLSTERVELGTILSYEQPTKYIVDSSDYVEDGQTPVLTANKSFILGYTNEETGIFANSPVIIFDDFTTDSKFVDFSFKIKSSALKILKPMNDVDPLLVYWLMTRVKAPVGGHKRHWISEYQYNEIPLPEKHIQKTISQLLKCGQQEIDLLKQLAEKYKTQKRGLMQKLLTGGWRVKPEVVYQYKEV